MFNLSRGATIEFPDSPGLDFYCHPESVLNVTRTSGVVRILAVSEGLAEFIMRKDDGFRMTFVVRVIDMSREYFS